MESKDSHDKPPLEPALEVACTPRKTTNGEVLQFQERDQGRDGMIMIKQNQIPVTSGKNNVGCLNDVMELKNKCNDSIRFLKDRGIRMRECDSLRPRPGWKHNRTMKQNGIVIQLYENIMEVDNDSMKCQNDRDKPPLGPAPEVACMPRKTTNGEVLPFQERDKSRGTLKSLNRMGLRFK